MFGWGVCPWKRVPQKDGATFVVGIQSKRTILKWEKSEIFCVSHVCSPFFFTYKQVLVVCVEDCQKNDEKNV